MSRQNEGEVVRRDPFFDAPLGRPWGGLMQGLMRDLPALGAEGAAPAGLPVPSVDVTETDEAYRIRAELAGVDKDDVAVELHDGVIEIRGEKKSRRDERGEKGRLLECSYGAFSRRFALPSDADATRIDAKFDGGILEVTVAKAPESKPQQIAVKG